MKIILLSGGSGKRLWPLSNDSRSKQFLKVLKSPTGEKESMTQRVVRQIAESGIKAEVIIATSANQQDIIMSQLGDKVSVVVEPSRRDTFPAIALSCAYLHFEMACPDDEIVAVLPCDQFTEQGYFHTIRRMAEVAREHNPDLVLMGIRPKSASSSFGYILPEASGEGLRKVSEFVEKPSKEVAESIIARGGLWNGGVFVFRLGYVMDRVKAALAPESFASVKADYDKLPKISFDYEVVEKARSIAVESFDGEWKDLGSWDALGPHLDNESSNYIMCGCTDTSVANELSIPVICIGTQDIVVAASHDGILVTAKSKATELKEVVSAFDKRPMFEERRWGEFMVIDETDSGSTGPQSLTKRLTIKAGKGISYQRHNHRSEVWTLVKGTGKMVLDGRAFDVVAGDTIQIGVGQLHTIRAVTDIEIIEVQFGNELREDDIERFDWEW